MRSRSFHRSRACPAFLLRPGFPAMVSASAPGPASWSPTWSPAIRPWSIRRRFACRVLQTVRTRGRTRSRAESVYRGEFLDAQTSVYALDQLFRVIDDADRVLVGGRAPSHVGLAFGGRREIVDQELDLVIVGILVVQRRRHAVIDTAMRANAQLLQPLISVDQLVEAAKGEGDMIETRRVRLSLRQRPGIEEGDAVMLVVITDERDALGFVKYLGAEHPAVPIDHLAPAIGLQHDVR